MTRQAQVHDIQQDRHLTEKPDWRELQPEWPLSQTAQQPPTSSPQQVAQLLSPTTGANPPPCTPKFPLCKSFLSGKVFSDLQCSSFWRFTVRGEAWRPKLEFLSRLGWDWKLRQTLGSAYTGLQQIWAAVVRSSDQLLFKGAHFRVPPPSCVFAVCSLELCIMV